MSVKRERKYEDMGVTTLSRREREQSSKRARKSKDTKQQERGMRE